ncbi:DUF2169 domain-containing protein [Archangium minus]|uniref:DUF2169 domain-containing protein n=1 Tax=Archangium minus TaxID=83450 RepID=A0ABY9X867_9BACT|nr:DUF2169 domain-containing protein [Archangium minus]
MELVHDSPFIGALESVLDRDGAEVRVALLKATYTLEDSGRLRIAEEQEPLWQTDQYLSEPGSSVLYESDGAYYKPGTDVVVVGSVFAPGGRPTTSCQCLLAVGSRRKILQVFGDRRWSYSWLTGVTRSDPQPFVEMPICWERAFGGSDPSAQEHGAPAWESRNPIGTGCCWVKSPSRLDGLALPNFEDPHELITSWKDKPAPQGLGFIGRSWMPRLRHAGTYDDAWRKYRRPLPPEDFDYHYFQGAPPELVHATHLRGGELVRAVNLTKKGTEQFHLPDVAVTFHVQSRRRLLRVPGVLDTVVFSFAMRRLSLVWRCKYPVLMNEASDEARAEVHFRSSTGG